MSASAFSPATAAPQRDSALTLLVATSVADADTFDATSFPSIIAHTTLEVLRVLTHARPRVVAIDWDVKEIDGAAVCHEARQRGCAVLVATHIPERAPAALKAGCHAM